MNYVNRIGAVFGLLSTIGGLYGTIIAFTNEASALYFLLVIVGVLGVAPSVSSIADRLLRRLLWLAASLVTIALVCFSWARGGPQAVWEIVTCDLKLPYCTSAKAERIARHFANIHLQAFNDTFSRDEIKDHQTFCTTITGHQKAQVALFQLSTKDDQRFRYDFSYTLKSGADWRIAAHDPLITVGVAQENANIGRLLLPSRVDRSPMFIGPGSATIMVRVCGVPRSAPDGNQKVRSFLWTGLDVENIVVKSTPEGRKQ